MYNYKFTDRNNKEWERIDKRRARGLYNKGVSIVITPDNLRPFTMRCNEIEVNTTISRDIDNKPYDFDNIVNCFEVYNCINRETGYRAAFYMEVKKDV